MLLQACRTLACSKEPALLGRLAADPRQRCGYSSGGWPSGCFAPRASVSGASTPFLCASDRGVPKRGDVFAQVGTTPSTRLLLEQAASRVATISIPTRRSAAVAAVVLNPSRSLGTARLTARYAEPYVGYFCDRDNAAARGLVQSGHERGV
jgi:hypothetical protein